MDYTYQGLSTYTPRYSSFLTSNERLIQVTGCTQTCQRCHQTVIAQPGETVNHTCP